MPSKKDRHKITCREDVPDDYFIDNSLIQNVEIEGIGFIGERFNNSRFLSADFKRCSFEDCVFHSLDMQRVTFTDCTFRRCLLSPELRIITAAFVRSTLVDCGFARAFIQNASFTDCELTGCDFSRIKAKSLLFVRTRLATPEFTQAALTRAVFRECHNTVKREWFRTAKLDDCEFEWADAFVIMQFGTSDSNNYWDHVIQPVLAQANADPFRVDKYHFEGRITDQILDRISTCRFVVAECSALNKNVYFEVGYSMGRGTPVILCIDKADNIPFDLKDYTFLIHGGDISVFKRLLEERVKFILSMPRHEINEA